MSCSSSLSVVRRYFILELEYFLFINRPELFEGDFGLEKLYVCNVVNRQKYAFGQTLDCRTCFNGGY